MSHYYSATPLQELEYQREHSRTGSLADEKRILRDIATLKTQVRTNVCRIRYERESSLSI